MSTLGLSPDSTHSFLLEGTNPEKETVASFTPRPTPSKEKTRLQHGVCILHDTLHHRIIWDIKVNIETFYDCCPPGAVMEIRRLSYRVLSARGTETFNK